MEKLSYYKLGRIHGVIPCTERITKKYKIARLLGTNFWDKYFLWYCTSKIGYYLNK